VLPWIYTGDLCAGLEAHHLPKQEALDGTVYPDMYSQDDEKRIQTHPQHFPTQLGNKASRL